MSAGARPTVTAVARAAGVSPSTASRALRDDPRVSAATKERVLAQARAMGFRSNHMARALRLGGPTTLLGLVVPDLQDPFFTAVATAVQAAAAARGHQVIIGSHNEDVRAQQRLVDQLVAHRVSAIMLVPAPGTDPRPLEREVGFGTPLVLLDRPVPGLACDMVTTDNAGGAATLTEALLARGHRRLGLLTLDPGIWTMAERLAGVRDTLARHDLAMPDDDRIVHGAPEALGPRVRDLLAAPDAPTALLCLSVPPLLNALLSGVVPPTVEVASFDAHPVYRLLPRPVLCVEQDTGEIGRVAVARALGDAPARQAIALPLSPLRHRGGGLHD